MSVNSLNKTCTTMTVNRNDVITIPKWLVIWLLPMLIAGITSYGFYRANNAKLEEKIASQEKTVIKIENNKVSTGEFKMMQGQLDRIETKLDQHITE